MEPPFLHVLTFRITIQGVISGRIPGGTDERVFHLGWAGRGLPANSSNQANPLIGKAQPVLV